MDKLTLTVSPEDWGHLVTKYKADSKKVSIADFTDGTINVETDTKGLLTKRKGGPNYNATLLAAAAKDQYEAIFSDGTRHLLVVANGEVRYSSGDTIFNSVVNGTGFSASGNFEFALTQDRVYGGNGINPSQVYDRGTSYGGVTYTAPRMKAMGAQAPSSAPTAGAPTAGGSVPNGAHTYKITFLYYDSEESNGSPASGVQTAGAGNNTIPLTSIPIGGYGVTARKIYRDNNDGLWLHIATLTNNTATTFSDTINVGVTPTEIPTTNDTPPTFARITLWLDQLWVSGVPGDPSTLFYSDTDRPDIFPDSNQILCNQEDFITAHVVYFDRLIVFNRRSMGQILGKTSDTYRYAAIPSSVGCVDNRTLQIRVIEGVPILIWLSDRGFYSYDGNSINYISDEIEDLVNFNIQQALQQKNSVSQSSFSGTSEDGISLTEIPGSITTRGYLNGTSTLGTNPRRNWDDQTDWEGGSSKQNIVTTAGDNLLKNPIRFAPTLAAGTLNNAIIQGSNLKLSLATNFTGESEDSTRYVTSGASPDTTTKIAYSFVLSRAATLTNFTIPGFAFIGGTLGQTYNYRLVLWNNSSGNPSTVRVASSTQSVTAGLFGIASVSSDSFSLTHSLSAGTYWIGFETLTTGIFVFQASKLDSPFNGGTTKAWLETANSWTSFSNVQGAVIGDSTNGSYTVCTGGVAKSGQWISSIHDSQSAYITTTLQIVHTGVYTGGSFCSGSYTLGSTTRLEGSNDPNFLGGAQVFEDFSNVNGTQNYTISGKRYWRIRITLTTTDDRATPTVGTPVLKFNQTGTWDSESIDTTLQSTVYNSLATTSVTPSGTSVTVTIATSASSSGPWGGTGNADGQFGAFGSHIVRQYVRIRVSLSSDTGNTVTPSVSSVIFKWTVSAKYTSTIIDTGVTPPAGWDLFIADFTTNGGTVAFQMRSATTSGGIPAATFFTVTPSEFPSAVTPLQFTQWRVTITSADEDVPQVDSVTIQWFISTISSIRPASIFTDGRYYVSLAEVGSTVNNILLQIDLNGKWRRLAGLNIGTFSFFFNRPYLGLASSGQIRKFLDATTDAGVAIEFDWRTKAFDYSTAYQNNSSKVKVVGEVILHGVNTGAAFQVFYSVDGGTTFINLVTNSGATTYTSASDGEEFYIRLRPIWDGSNDIDGRTIMYRVHSNDINEVELYGLEEVNAFLRKQAPVTTG